MSKSHRVMPGLIPGLALCLLLLPCLVYSQQYYDPGIQQRSIHRKPTAYEAEGVRLGSFILKPAVELTLEHNNNIYYIDETKVADTLFHIQPKLALVSDWGRHALNFDAGADIARYSDYGDEDYEDWWVTLDGRVDVKRGNTVNYGATYKQLHEERNSPDYVHGIKPSEFSYSGFDLGYERNFNRLTANLGYDRFDTDYDNNVNSDGEIVDNQDRDRSRDTLALRLDYERSPGRSIFVGGAINNNDYDLSSDSEGYDRSSDGYRLQAGIARDLTGVLVGDLYLEYIDQQYDDVRFDDVNGFGLGARLEWTPSKMTSVGFEFRNSPQETTQVGSSGYFSSLYAIRLQHELRRYLLANLRFSYTDNRYEANLQSRDPSEDPNRILNNSDVTRADIGLTYLFSRHFFISAGYTYEKQDADVDVYNFDTNRWFLTLGLDR
ncbi:MAG: outer membrane beta-barrel protein [Xanthomonadales bacterium]|nr:outer membrane beta-barrel protein [Xanthomonadales bacterium]